MSDLVKIARTYVPFQTTHFDGCEREHIECLVQRMADEIERLQERLRIVAAERDEHARWRAKLADDLHDRETQIIELRRQLAEANVTDRDDENVLAAGVVLLIIVVMIVAGLMLLW